MQMYRSAILPPRLKQGDHVRLISPASTPTHEGVEAIVNILKSWGLIPEIGKHVFDNFGGYLAGKDEDRLSDLNDAIRDPNVKAILTTRGGKGAYRIADRIDFESMNKNPKIYIGFSESTVIELALWKYCNISSIHGGIPSWSVANTLSNFPDKIERLFNLLTTANTVEVKSQKDELTSQLTTSGKATGFLMGGNQDMIAMSSGWTLPNLDGAILLLEDVEKHLGFIDRQLTMLKNSGAFKGLRGIAVGRYLNCGPAEHRQGYWTVIDVLRDRLKNLEIPILGGLPIGHGDNTDSIPLGTKAILDADAGLLTVSAGVK